MTNGSGRNGCRAEYGEGSRGADGCVAPPAPVPLLGRLRADVNREIAELGFRARDLDKLIGRQADLLDTIEHDLEALARRREEARTREAAEAETPSPAR